MQLENGSLDIKNSKNQKKKVSIQSKNQKIKSKLDNQSQSTKKLKYRRQKIEG